MASKCQLLAKSPKNTGNKYAPLINQSIFCLCEELYSSDYTEEAFVVSFWLPNYIDKLEPSDLATFKDWIEKYIDNWAKCDGFCNHTVGDLIQKYPETLAKLKAGQKAITAGLNGLRLFHLLFLPKKALFCKTHWKYATFYWLMGMIWCRKVTGGCLKRKAECTKKKFSTM